MAHPTLPSVNPDATLKTPSLSEPARTILALDLGTTTGWAIRGYDGLITTGTASFRPGRYDGGGMRYLRPSTGSNSWPTTAADSPRSTSRRSAGTLAPTPPTSTAASWRR